MKVAAAVLGASLLFFLGVLTGAGRKELLPPPTAIPLGVATPASPTAAGDRGAPVTRPPSPPRAPRTTERSPSSGAGTPTTASTVTTLPSGATAGPGSPGPGEPPATTPPGATPTPTSPAAPTSTTAPPSSAGSGGVEQVDGEVDCTPAGKRGKGKREACPETTTTSAPERARGRTDG